MMAISREPWDIDLKMYSLCVIFSPGIQFNCAFNFLVCVLLIVSFQFVVGFSPIYFVCCVSSSFISSGSLSLELFVVIGIFIVLNFIVP